MSTLTFSIMTPDEIFEAFGGRDAFFPEDDYLFSEEYTDFDGRQCRDVVGRKSWTRISCGDVPNVLMPFHYLKTDRHVWDPSYRGYEKRYAVARRDEQIVAVMAFGWGGMEWNDIDQILQCNGVPFKKLYYLSYISVHETEGNTTDGIMLMNYFLYNYLDSGDVAILSHISESEEEICRYFHPLKNDPVLNVTTGPKIEEPDFTRPIRLSWTPDDYVNSFDSRRRNLYVTDTAFSW